MITSKLRAAAVVFLVGFSLGLAVFTASRIFIRSVLTADAVTATDALSARLAEGKAIGAETLTGIARYSYFDAQGNLIASGGMVDPEGSGKTAQTGNGARQDVDWRVILPSLLGLMEPDNRSVSVPVMDGARRIGTVFAQVNQSAALERLSRAFSTAAMVVIALVGLAGMLVAASFTKGKLLGDRRPLDTSRLPHDEVTGLLNRASFLKVLDNSVKQATKADRPVGLMLVELCRFRAVNDTWGHHVGDQVLAEAAERLKAFGRPVEKVARFSGAGFALVLEADTDTHSVRQLGDDIHKALTTPFIVDDSSIALGARSGVALFPVNADSADVLFRAADMALSRAKQEKKPNLCFFDTEMGKRMRRRSALERDLRRAVEKNEFVLFYQPQLELSSSKVRGYEALVRWERPGEGIVSPADFLAVAEETGLIRPIGEWVLRRACQDAMSWVDEGTVSVNFSGAQFANPEVDRLIAAVLQETGLPPGRLEIEVPESLILLREANVMEALERIKALGVRVAMDDFGTGYSSLASLSRFPFDKIKIDRTFVNQLAADPEVAAIVSSVVGLGRSLSVEITAEGVETQEQVTLLKAAGCSMVQGFLFGVPQRASSEPAPALAEAVG